VEKAAAFPVWVASTIAPRAPLDPSQPRKVKPAVVALRVSGTKRSRSASPSSSAAVSDTGPATSQLAPSSSEYSQ
jgi:hypothetical protein